MTAKRVKFCQECVYSYPCKVCDDTFKRSRNVPLQSTTFHQIPKDFTTFYSEEDTSMIVDIGCPTSVIGKTDENRFIQNLSKYQQKNLEIKYVDENFKFGPSGP